MMAEETWFENRADAGRRLAERLEGLGLHDPVVLALPRGGVPVASEVAKRLACPLDVLVVRKLGAPSNPEFGIGAIAERGTLVIDSDTVEMLGIRAAELESIVAREREELERRVRTYRGSRPMIDIEGREVIVIDDGIATGVTDAAALRAVRKMKPAKVVLGVPVCANKSVERMTEDADEVLCLTRSDLLFGVGHWYLDFSQVSDEEVLDALAKLGVGGDLRHSDNGLSQV